MIRLHAAGLTDVGRVRQGNEDSLHVGDSVFAVADGMGGHAAGEVASALALEPIAKLDGHVFGDVDEARAALLDAVVAANELVVAAASEDTAKAGMGTTLTAALFEGRRLHVAHVGDSRGYLLRGGRVLQLTHDHTFVQQLIDAGSITEEEAAVHPQRSVVTRAIGVRAEIEVDLDTLELESGDAVLLCSDGLSGVVSIGTIAQLLTSGRPPEEVVTALVGAANAAGAPDNVTVVLLTVVNEPDGPHAEAPAAGAATGAATGEATEAPPGPRAPVQIRPDRDAAPMRPLPGPGPDESVVVDPVARRRRRLSVLIGVAVVLGLTIGGGWWLLSRSYFVGVEDDTVAIYQGVPASLGPLSLSWVVEETSLSRGMVASYQQEQLDQGIPAVDRNDARNIVATLRAAGEAEDAEQQRPTGTTGTEEPAPAPTATPAPRPPTTDATPSPTATP